MRKSSTGLFLVLLLNVLTIQGQPATTTPVFKTLGVKLNVTDLDKAIEFYQGKLGFALDSKTASASEILLSSTDGQKIVLHLVKNLLPEAQNENCAVLTLQVNDLDKTIAALKEKGIDFGNTQKRKEGVGYAITIMDPFKNSLSLMHQTIVKVDPFPEPRVYNYGFLVPNMAKAQEFYTKSLGFVVRSEKYLPLDLPLGHSDKTFAFMLHFREGVEAISQNSPDAEHVVILFQTPDLEAAIKHLRQHNVQLLQKEPRTTLLGKSISFYDPFGYLSELVEVK